MTVSHLTLYEYKIQHGRGGCNHEPPPPGLLRTARRTPYRPLLVEASSYSTTEAAAISGFTVRVLDDLVRVYRVIAPSESEPIPGSGTYRRWSESDVRILTVLRRLRDLRASHDVLRVAAKQLQRTPPRVNDTRWLVASPRVALLVPLRDLPSVVSDGCYVVRAG